MVIGVTVGSVLGFLAGLGVGGGSLLMLWLTLVLDMPHTQARVWNLMFFLPCALISSFFRLRQKSLPIKKIWPAMVCGCLAAALFSFWGTMLDLKLLKKVFGGLLILTGTREILYRKKE